RAGVLSREPPRRRAEPEARVDGQAAGNLGRIVIVEDDEVLLEQLTWALKGKFSVSSARDATHGKALCDSEPDLFLFDMRLPPSGQVHEGLELRRTAA